MLLSKTDQWHSELAQPVTGTAKGTTSDQLTIFLSSLQTFTGLFCM